MRRKFRRSNLPKSAVKGMHFFRLAQAKARNVFPRKRIPAKFSIVAACYNVEDYIDDFFFSLTNQTIDPECLEIIAVDDGSTDRTSEKIKYWARHFRGTVHYIYQKNQRQAVARNNGMKLATGDWICFADPDDFLSPDYVEHVYAEIEKEDAKYPISMISCNLIFFREARNKARDEHPLRYRFLQSHTRLRAGDLEDHMQLSASHAWFRRSFIENQQLRFDNKIVPTFEDGHFVNKLLISNPDTRVIFLSKPIYYYRKRESGGSTIDGSTGNKAWYLDQLRYGYLDLLEYAKRFTGEIPRFLQRTILYDVLWRIKHLAGHPERNNILNESERTEFFDLMERIFSYISAEAIEEFDLAGCEEKERVGFLALKSADPLGTNIFIRQYDAAKALFQVSYHSRSGENQLTVRVESKWEPIRFQSRTAKKIFDRVFYFEHFCWVAIEAPQEVAGYIGGTQVIFRTKMDVLGTTTTGADMKRALEVVPINGAALKRRWRRIRRQAIKPHIQRKYKNCWLVMDRDDRADDNAEHFYRYLLAGGKAKNAYFVLRPTSPDWERLKVEGFQLLDFKSKEHIYAYLNARLIISSDAAESLLHPLPMEVAADRVKSKFIFLQHGIIKDDLSRWLNGKKIARFITATDDEYKSIAAHASSYEFSEKEVVLTGLCRHDKLLRERRAANTILVMPTWRNALSPKHVPKKLRAKKDIEFQMSEYVSAWSTFLAAPRLREIAESHGLTIVFSPHPHVLPNLRYFNIPDHVQISAQTTGGLFPPLFAEAGILVTDYSSVAFDLAYLDKPVVYYQFDKEEFYSGLQDYERGYFDYDQHGFGPVCKTQDEALYKLDEALAGYERKEYGVRRQRTFAFRDGRSCERVYDAIAALDLPLLPDPPIALKTYKGVPNAGDAASEIIVQKYSRQKLQVVDNKVLDTPNLVGLGSILDWSDQNSIVWGSGFISENATLREKPAKIFAVRGPLSRKRLLEMGCECPQLYGDPGVLISNIFPSIEKQTGNVGIIPHYVDRHHPFVEEAERYGAQVIDPALPLPVYLSKLRSCECIISSSLHGIIFAHSYGIPASWVMLTDKVIGQGFKFIDYFMSIGFNETDIPKLSAEDHMSSMIRAAILPRIEINRADIRLALDKALQFIFDRTAEIRSMDNALRASQSTRIDINGDHALSR